ncbi:class I adenylate-forming enzyme family protein [Nocardia mexicana]|uniref:Long-chain acyl-CoA synthetase n=1 Tax=Nocardia mexicana TaxID=279262 RepID=A0A370H6B7_9NOCA|nr:class I adenylate-forming enzyme family protein [Nocardia mexicana]RDI51631.1 long-chain acyl-CoA synthetase [Nocardia mexicana]
MHSDSTIELNGTIRHPNPGSSWISGEPAPDTTPGTVDELLTEAARSHGQRTAVQTDSSVLTFAALDDLADAVARALRDKVGSRRVIGIVADLDPAFPAYYYGGIRSDNVVAPINPLLPAPALAHVLELSAPAAVLVSDRGFEQFLAKALGDERLKPVLHEPIRLDSGWLVRTGFERGSGLPDDAAALMFTSGSTGPAKAVCYSHANIRANAEQLAAAHGLADSGGLAHSRPIYYPMHMNASVRVGTRQILAGHRNVWESVVVADQLRATHLYSLPVRLEQLAADPRFGDTELRHLTMIGSGSTALSARANARIRSTLGMPCWQGYGLTETTSLISTERAGAERIGSVGAAVGGISVRIAPLDSATPDPVPTGTPGQIWARGPAIMLGYYDGTAIHGSPGTWFPTGDYGSLDADGLLTVTDRIRDLVHRDGEVVSPSAVRRALESHPGVEECEVVGVRDGAAVRLVGFVNAAGGSTGLLEELRDTYSEAAQLNSIELVERLPRLPNGKVDRSALSDIARADIARGAAQ